MRVSHGCIRLYPEDIERLFSMVPVGTRVRIFDQAVKAGLGVDQIFLEVHQPLIEEEDPIQSQPSVADVMEQLRPYMRDGIEVDPKSVEDTVRRGDGIPMAISAHVGQEEDLWSNPSF
jgi:L,D-transpeptidase ErfK/SrfK